MAGRTADMNVVEWARSYAPFTHTVVKNTRKHKCDFCGESHAGKIVKLRCNANKKDLFACFGCDCLLSLLGKDTTGKLYLEAIIVSAGLIDNAMLKETETEGERLKDAMIQRQTGDIHSVMMKVKLLDQQGKATRWRIIPDLIRQYNERKSLSFRQLEVCTKFIKSCEKESYGG